jgi:hypothetical protein
VKINGVEENHIKKKGCGGREAIEIVSRVETEGWWCQWMACDVRLNHGAVSLPAGGDVGQCSDDCGVGHEADQP